MKPKQLLFVMCAGCLMSSLAMADDDRPRSYQTANFIAGPAQRPGAATLFRGRQDLEMRVATSGLMSNTSYTVWWVIFNNPDACVGGCGADDLARPGVRASVIYAAGFVTGTGDSGNVTAHLDAGTPPSGQEVAEGRPGGLDRGNGLAAEVHLVVRSHGTTTAGIVAQQIGSFNGGCSPACMNVQGAIFVPVAAHP